MALAQAADGGGAVKVTSVGGTTLAAVRKRGALRCGTSTAYPGFGEVDASGRWSGFDVDFCRAVAAAVFGDPGKVEFVPETAKTRLNALQNGEIDVLSRNTTWTLSRESAHDILFAGITFYDGQGFMVKRSLGVGSAADLAQQEHLRPAGHHDGAEPRRLLPRPRLALCAQDVPDGRGGGAGLP